MLTQRNWNTIVAVLICLLGMGYEASVTSADEKGEKKQNTTEAAPVVLNSCPVFPILTDGGGTLFYTDYYPSGCGPNVQAGYVYGTGITWPYTACGSAPCVAGKKLVATTGDWNGLSLKVRATHMHDDANSCLHVAPPEATKSITVEPNRPSHFVSFALPNTSTTRWAKVLEFKIIAVTGGSPKLFTKYVAFETEDPGIPNIEPLRLLKPRNDTAYRAITKVSRDNEPDRDDEVLLLLFNPNTQILCE